MSDHAEFEMPEPPLEKAWEVQVQTLAGTGSRRVKGSGSKNYFTFLLT